MLQANKLFRIRCQTCQKKSPPSLKMENVVIKANEAGFSRDLQGLWRCPKHKK